MAVRIYTKNYKETMETVYRAKAEFLSLFGEIEALDGISDSDVAFTVKTLDIPDVVNEYNVDPNVGMGTGTSNSSRFGPLEEVKAVNKDVPYKSTYSRNLAVDAFTVNEDIDYVVARSLAKVAESEVKKLNAAQSKAISEAAGKTFSVEEINEESVHKLFNELSKYYTDIEAEGTPVAKVTSDIYNIILDSRLTTREKQSTVNIDLGEVYMFKGFVVEKISENYFEGDTVVYTYIAGMGKAFTGINMARTIDEHPDFVGVALQVAGKYGDYIPEASKKAITKVELKAIPEG